jgi:hypothetical protein
MPTPCTYINFLGFTVAPIRGVDIKGYHFTKIHLYPFWGLATGVPRLHLRFNAVLKS